MANHVSRLIHMKCDKMQDGKLCAQLTHTKKGCKWNDIPIHTHYQNITCLTLLPWLMISNIMRYIKCTYFKIHIWLHMIKCICTHPQKFSSKHGENSHKWATAKLGAYVKKEIGTQNIIRRRKKCRNT